MKVIHLEKVEAPAVDMEGAEGVSKQLPLGSADGAPNFSFRVFTVQPGGHTPYHTHTSEHLNYIIRGKGCLIDADGTEKPLQTGDFALVRPNEKHQYRNKGSDPFVMICAVPKDYE